eukprot:2773225-Pleurochrysis_carterae.AAC.5
MSIAQDVDQQRAGRDEQATGIRATSRAHSRRAGRERRAEHGATIRAQAVRQASDEQGDKQRVAGRAGRDATSLAWRDEPGVMRRAGRGATSRARARRTGR